MDISPKHRILLLAVSVAILGLALFWWGRVEEQDPNRPLVELLQARGYQVESQQLYLVGSFPEQSIAQVLTGVDLEEAVAASLEGGFPSRIDAVGEVTLLLCALGNGDVITLFLLDGEAELCFIQPLDGGALKAIDPEVAP